MIGRIARPCACGCGQILTGRKARPGRRFYSLRCFAKWRETQPGWKEAQRRGAAASNRLRRRRALEQVPATVRGLSAAQAFWWGRQVGYTIGHKAGVRRGVVLGYEQALRDGDPGYAKACDLVSRGRMRQADAVARKGAA